MLMDDEWGRSQNVSLKHNGIFVFQQLFVF